MYLGPCMGEGGESSDKSKSSLLRDVEVPTEPPQFPITQLAELCQHLSDEQAPFLRHLDGCLTMGWLPQGDDRLGVTRFEMDHNAIYRAKRLRMPPGDVTIMLHPVLLRDEVLHQHTLVHELLHAAGLADHGQEHTEWLDLLAPPPSMANSLLLQGLRSEIIGNSKHDQWSCSNCGFNWERATVRRPSRCPKCARSMG